MTYRNPIYQEAAHIVIDVDKILPREIAHIIAGDEK
jgi:hypothetical protein